MTTSTTTTTALARRPIYGMLLEALGDAREHTAAMGVRLVIDPDCADADLTGDPEVLIAQLTQFLVHAAALAGRSGTVRLHWKEDSAGLLLGARDAAYPERKLELRFAHPPVLAAAQPAWTRDQLLCGLAGGQFLPYFLPQFDLASGQPYGVEVLPRWRHPELGMLEAEQFNDALEQAGLADRFIDTMFQQALASAELWRKAGLALALSLKLTPQVLDRPELARRLRMLAARYAQEPARVTFSVAESALAANPGPLHAALARLRAEGFGAAIDAFTLGRSSLLMLSEPAFTELKFERVIAPDMPAASDPLGMLDALMRQGQRQGWRTVAKGVTSADEADYLCALGCGGGQGDFFGRPMAAEQLLPWIRSRQARVGGIRDNVACT